MPERVRYPGAHAPRTPPAGGHRPGPRSPDGERRAERPRRPRTGPVDRPEGSGRRPVRTPPSGSGRTAVHPPMHISTGRH